MDVRLILDVLTKEDNEARFKSEVETRLGRNDIWESEYQTLMEVFVAASLINDRDEEVGGAGGANTSEEQARRAEDGQTRGECLAAEEKKGEKHRIYCADQKLDESRVPTMSTILPHDNVVEQRQPRPQTGVSARVKLEWERDMWPNGVGLTARQVFVCRHMQREWDHSYTDDQQLVIRESFSDWFYNPDSRTSWSELRTHFLSKTRQQPSNANQSRGLGQQIFGTEESEWELHDRHAAQAWARRCAQDDYVEKRTTESKGKDKDCVYHIDCRRGHKILALLHYLSATNLKQQTNIIIQFDGTNQERARQNLEAIAMLLEETAGLRKALSKQDHNQVSNLLNKLFVGVKIAANLSPRAWCERELHRCKEHLRRAQVPEADRAALMEQALGVMCGYTFLDSCKTGCPSTSCSSNVTDVGLPQLASG